MLLGAWGVLAFDNDTANDWAYDLEGADDLSLVRSALDEVITTKGDYVRREKAWIFSGWNSRPAT